MKKPILLWIIGSYGSGKTTQMKNLIDVFKSKEPKKNEGVSNGWNFMYTTYGANFSVIGQVKQNQCTGLDSVYSKLKKEGISQSILKSVEGGAQLVLLECVFASGAWYEQFIKDGLLERMNLIMVHLDLDLFDNFKRIAQRKAKKAGIDNWWEIHHPDSLYKNAGNKNKETKIIYDKCMGLHKSSFSIKPESTLKLDAMLSEEELTDLILEEIEKFV